MASGKILEFRGENTGDAYLAATSAIIFVKPHIMGKE